MKIFAILFTLLAVLHGQNRALLIGNNNYEYVSKLNNPHNDVNAVGNKLKSEGWLITPILDADFKTMRKEIGKFAKLKSDRIILYYAGHGLEINGENFLCPTDAALEENGDQDGETVSLNWIMKKITGKATGIKLVVLDCCRDNPFATRSWMGSRSIDRSLKKVNKDLCANASIVLFSGAPGNTVPDGSGKNSPFTKAFLEELEIGGRISYHKFVGGVAQRIESTQKPWYEIDGDAKSASLFADESLLAPLKSDSGQTINNPVALQNAADQKALNAKLDQLLNQNKGNDADKERQHELELKKMELEIARLKAQQGTSVDQSTSTAPESSSKEDAVKNFANRYFNALSQSGSSYSSLFSNSIDYQYAKTPGHVNRTHLKDAHNSLANRWPKRHYSPDGSYSYELAGNRAFLDIPFYYSYSDYNSKQAKGYATDNLTLEWTGTQWLINRYRQTVRRTRLDK